MSEPQTGERTEPPSDELARTRSRVQELERLLAEREESLGAARLQLEQTEAALGQLSALLGGAPLPVLLMDLQGVVTDANAEAERFCGRARSALLGARLADIVPSDHADRCAGLLAECRAGHVVRGVEQALFARRAGLSALRIALFPVVAADGSVVGVVLSEDIRELKRTGTLLADVNRELQLLATVDALTGTANRREYERVLAREIARAARTRRWLSLGMIDIDEFKRLNDTLGHAAGDDTLVAVARALRGELHRPADFLARYGGEEFVVLLPGSDPAGARLLGERMRRAVEGLRRAHPDSPVGTCVTISVGIVSARVAPGTDAERVERAADEMLYAAKRRGRNRVECTVLGGRASEEQTAAE